MSRPRKPEDRRSFPEACGRCGGHYQVVANWPDARVCGYCYQAAKRTRGTCACGHVGVLPGRIHGSPACRKCSRIQLNVDCRGCGAESELHSDDLCWACVLGHTVDQLMTDPNTGQIPDTLIPVADALKTMNRANSGLTWINQPHVTGFLAGLVTSGTITHTSLDALPRHPTREHVRGLLVEHGALPRRDERRIRFDVWADAALLRLPAGEHRDTIRQFIRWHIQRRMTTTDQISEGTFLRSKQTVTVAIDFLNWLTTERGTSLAELTQADLDHWQASGPTTREFASRFLAWAKRTHRVAPELRMQPHRRGTSQRLASREQTHALQVVTDTDELTPRYRLAAILVLVFGQQVEDVARLTWESVTITEDLVTITLGAFPVALTAPLDQPVRELADSPDHRNTAAHPDSPWVFLGSSPGRHITGAALRQQLKTLFSARAARLGTLHELARTTPQAILGEALGYSPATIERHAVASASTYARYIGTRQELRQHQRP